MESQDSQFQRLTKTFSAFTSQIFRCPGLETPPPNADRLGGQDLAFWLVFVALLSGWFLFYFAPQRDRLKQLEGRQQMLTTHLQAEKRELLRMQRSTQELMKDNPLAWERAARGRLGWISPGEVVDVKSWRPTRVAPQNPRANLRTPEFSLSGNPVPAPEIPQLPRLPNGFRPTGSTASYRELLNPQVGVPPRPPAPQPVRSSEVTNRVSVPPASRTMRRQRN